MLYIWIFIFATFKSTSAVTESIQLNDHCAGKSFYATCYGKQVIKMNKALYGRMELGTCINTTMGFEGCFSDVTDIADHICSGKRACEIRLPNAEMDKAATCFKGAEVVKYMQTTPYTCVPVEHIKRQSCNGAIPVTVTENPTHLASLVTNETGCGNSSSPWILEAQPGQNIVVNIYDFSWKNMSTKRVSNPYGCVSKLGYILDLETEEMIRFCGEGTEKYRHLYTSVGNKVQVVLNKEAVSRHSFLIEYRAQGCPNLAIAKDAVMHKQEDAITIECKETRQSWHLRCQGTRWQGVIGNCTHHSAVVQHLLLDEKDGMDFTNDNIEMMIFWILVIAFAICLMIIGIGFILIKRNTWTSSYSKPMMRTYALPQENVNNQILGNEPLLQNKYPCFHAAGHLKPCNSHKSKRDINTTDYQLPFAKPEDKQIPLYTQKFSDVNLPQEGRSKTVKQNDIVYESGFSSMSSDTRSITGLNSTHEAPV